MTIQQYVKTKLETISSKDLSYQLNISLSMLSAYKEKENGKNYNPSLTIAKKVYQLDKITLHPFSEEGLIKEIENV